MVAPGDIDGLVDRLERLMQSPDLRKTIGLAGMRTASQFSTERIISRLIEIYAASGFLRAASPGSALP